MFVQEAWTDAPGYGKLLVPLLHVRLTPNSMFRITLKYTRAGAGGVPDEVISPTRCVVLQRDS